MQYILAFFEGIITFISPCLLPMLPVYISYFAGHAAEPKKNVLRSALGFVCGFTAIFLLLGAFAGSVGALLSAHRRLVDIITGGVVALFGLGYLGAFRLPSLRLAEGNAAAVSGGFFSAMLFGMAFSLGWTPCIGAFLGSALLMASQQGSMMSGMLMLLCYSAGLGIPFLLAAVLIEQLSAAFSWIKSHYRAINIISGAMLLIMGILMMTGLMNTLYSAF